MAAHLGASVRHPRDDPGSDPPRLRCAQVPITACNPAEAAARLVDLATAEHATGEQRTGLDVHLCNAYTLALVDRDPDLLRMFTSAALNLPDGLPVVWANRLRYSGVAQTRQRVYGPDLLRDVVDLGRKAAVRHYFLGSTEPVLLAMERNLLARFPTVQIVGTHSPPFTEPDARTRRLQDQRIADSGAQVVWVGLGTPKQDWEAARLAAELPVVAVAVGAAFDFMAGIKPQAPAWMQSSGLEWLFRLGTEPRRLWRRYLFGNPRFVLAAGRDAFRSRQDLP